MISKYGKFKIINSIFYSMKVLIISVFAIASDRFFHSPKISGLHCHSLVVHASHTNPEQLFSPSFR